MIQAVKNETLKQQNILILVGSFILFLGLYTFLDFEGNTNYTVMANDFGNVVVGVHILINIIIAILTAIMVTFSIVNYKLTNIEPKGSNAIPFLAFIFGIFTFGCTSCVVAFVGSIGIAFTPLVLPNGNLLWKIAALLFVALGFIWIMYSIQNAKCEIKDNKSS